MRDDAHLLCAVRNAHAKVVVVLKEKQTTNEPSQRSLSSKIVSFVHGSKTTFNRYEYQVLYYSHRFNSISECVMMQFNIANRTYLCLTIRLRRLALPHSSFLAFCLTGGGEDDDDESLWKAHLVHHHLECHLQQQHRPQQTAPTAPLYPVEGV